MRSILFCMLLALVAFNHAAARESRPGDRRLMEEAFSKLDTNGDKKLSEEEFLSGKGSKAKGKAKKRFKSLDENVDSSLSLREYQNL